MQVGNTNSVAFTASTRKTKKGNDYQHTNLGKNIGTYTMLGLTGLSTAVAFRKIPKGNMKFSLEIKGLSRTKTMLLMGAAALIPILGIATLGRLIGGIPDAFVNSSRRKKADQQA